MRGLGLWGGMLGLVLLGAAPAAAQRTLVLERFDVDLEVDAAGGLRVVETIRPRFEGPWNGIYRLIPVEYRTPQGLNYTLRLTDASVTDGEGRALRVETSRERHYRKVKIWVPGAVDATRTVVLRYRVANALRFFEEHDELYWNVTGDEWDVPIEAASARIVLPAGVEHVRAVAFTGGYGSREQAARVEVRGAEVAVTLERALGMHEGLTVAVAWNPGVVRRPTLVQRVADVVRSNGVLIVPVLVLPGMWWLWRTRGRDPGRGPLVVQYEPPAGLTPGELGTLVDSSPDLRDLTATIVDLAVRGYVRVEEQTESRLFGLLTSRDYRFHLRKPEADWADLKPHERGVLRGLFGAATRGGEDQGSGQYGTVTLSSLRHRFYKHLPGIKDRLFEELIGLGFYARRPDRVRQVYVVTGIVAGSALAVGGGLASQRLGVAPASAVIAGVLTGAIVVTFGWFMPARTRRGARALEVALGFEEFLRRVEADRFDRVVKTPELFERFLPYAMVLGVERQWAEAFEDICTRAPSWYVGSGVPSFRTTTFADQMGQLSRTAGAVLSSAPRSAGGSGFGGGSSGGGFGGGGGGGF